MVAAGVLAIAACSGPPGRAIDRLAILPFENLSGNPSLNWVSATAPLIVSSEIAGAPNVVPLRVETINDAYGARATRFVHGYFTGQENALHFQIAVEDAASHKTVATLAQDGNILTATRLVATQLDRGAHEFSTTKTDAATAWGRGDFEQAVKLDPEFGAAWLSWSEKLTAGGNTAQALDVTAQALKQPGLRSAVDRAQIALMSANLRKDADARRNALMDLARLVKTDTSLLTTLAEIEFNARRYSEAAKRYRELLAVDTADAKAMNLLGYAEAFGGNLDAAKKAFEDYGKQPGEKPNSLDSTGEGYFANGRFADAEKYFLEAHDADPALSGGADLLKAAYAHWLGGDLRGADAIMKRYLDFRTNQHDPTVIWRQASWEYATGRAEPAISRLQAAPPNLKDLAEKQIAVWRGAVKLPTDLAALQDLYQRTPPTADGVVRVLYAAALAEAGRKDDARKLLALWPLPDTGGDPLLHSLVYPKFLSLRK